MEGDDTPECLQRIGLGVPDVGAAVAALKARGVEFVESTQLHPEDRGALTRNALGSVSFELVHQTR
jgi:4-hydroxyphenylpyruvate dioxygenase